MSIASILLLLSLQLLPAPSQPGSEPTVSVMVVTYVPCEQACRSPDASGYRFLLQKPGGEWGVVKKLPVWIA